MNRYTVSVNIYVDAESETEAETIVTQMMGGAEMMSRMWVMGTAEKRWECSHD